jgi:hypothetical protein
LESGRCIGSCAITVLRLRKSLALHSTAGTVKSPAYWLLIQCGRSRRDPVACKRWDETTSTGRVGKRGNGAVQVSQGKFVWWYQVTTPAGAQGWWMQEGLAAVGVGPLAYKCDFKKGEADTGPN